MKQIFILAICIIVTSDVFATVQEADLLIVRNDTIYLKAFPLETLELVNRPFGITRQTAPSTACWRGYRAIWRIIDERFYLEKIIRCDTDREEGEQDIRELFKENGIDFRETHGMILAEWVSVDFFRLNLSAPNLFDDKIYLYDAWVGKEKHADKKLRLKIDNGKIRLNRL